MGTEYFIFYTEASVVCILILLMMLVNDKLHSAKQEKQLCFDRALLAFLLYFASDACWAGMLSHQLPRIRFLIVLMNLLNFILMGVLSYEWFLFMAASENMAFRKDRKKRLLVSLPMIVSVAGIVLAYLADPTFWISESGDLNGLYTPLLLIAPSFYLLAALICSVINARKTESREKQRQYRLIAFIPLGVMGSGLIQVLFLNAPTFCFGCTLMLLFFYIQNMQALISVDELTQLNDHGQIDRYMEQYHYRENARVFVLMFDVDRFKQINDTYGHAEGDRALVLVSEAFKQVCDRLKASVFLGRYGGDEFVIILQDPEESAYPEQAVRAIRAALTEKQRENRLPYALDISVGCEELRGKDDTLQACLIRADEKLYEEKRGKASAR